MEASREEEFWNALTHFIGLLGSIIGMCYLLYTNNDLPKQSLSSVLFFGFGLVSVYLSSTLYHYVSEPVLKEKLRIFDHISIYYLIAGSYAPVCLITLLDKSGIYIFIAVCITVMYFWEKKVPGGSPRRGILGLDTTRGDRLFVSLLGSAFIHLAWLGLVGSLLWIATIICVAYFVLVFKYV